MFSLEPEIPWRIEYGFNISVDFCIWVLQLDGLRIPPFDQHPQGNGELQARGLNAESWRRWLATVVALQDSILFWHKNPQDQQLWIEEQLATYNVMASQLTQYPEWSNEKIDLPALRSTLERHCASYEQQYQAAAALVSHIPGDPVDYIDRPSDVFPDSLVVREFISSLWQRYEPRWERERVNGEYIEGEQVRLTGVTNKWQDLQYLNIYLVNYPAPVEYLIPPVSVIVSSRHELLGQSDTFNDFLLRAAIGLTQSNR